MRQKMTFLGEYASVTRRWRGPTGSTGILTHAEWRSLVDAELRRARRYEHPLAILAVSPLVENRWRHLLASVWGLRSDASAPERKVTTTDRHSALELLLRSELRETDLVTYDVSNRLFTVFLLESTTERAVLAARRLDREYRALAAHALQYGVASFPDDGLTLADITGAARQAWRDASLSLVPTGPHAEVSIG